ncbi:MAG: hypothetical protein ACJASV_002575, partial [Pseudorhodobacter sp.]
MYIGGLHWAECLRPQTTAEQRGNVARKRPLKRFRGIGFVKVMLGEQYAPSTLIHYKQAYSLTWEPKMEPIMGMKNFNFQRYHPSTLEKRKGKWYVSVTKP